MRIILAPMEGVIDYEMRDLLTRIGGYDRCVTEFVRVTDNLLPNRVFKRFSPELDNGGMTPAGVPVYLQLLGGNPQSMALNAARAQRLEPPGIDINFGCPSKTVNKSDGGSVLLKEPARIGAIVGADDGAVAAKHRVEGQPFQHKHPLVAHRGHDGGGHDDRLGAIGLAGPPTRRAILRVARLSSLTM